MRAVRRFMDVITSKNMACCCAMVGEAHRRSQRECKQWKVKAGACGGSAKGTARLARA